MLEEVRQALAKQLDINIDKITADSKIKDDLGADSLDILELLMTIEEEFGIMIPDESLVTFEKVSDVVAYMEANKN